MSEKIATGSALLVLAVIATAPAMLALRRGHRFFSPTVCFPLAYAFMTTGPVLWYLLTGWYYAGVVREHAVPVLLSCASAIAAFQAGAWWMVVRPRRAAAVGEAACSREAMVRSASLVLLLGALACYAFASVRMRQEVGPADKSSMLAFASAATLRLYTLSAAAVMVVGLIAVAADSRGRMGRPSGLLMLILVTHAGLCLWNGERDVVFLVLGWVVINAHLLGRRLIPAIAGLTLFIAAVPVLRMPSESVSQGRTGSIGRTAALLAGSLLTQTSSNFYVFTNVVDWVPVWQDHRNGATYLDALASFLPESLTGEKKSLAGWFKTRYAPRSTVGYGFAMDAEGYLNFGWLGPPVVFMAWGSLMGWLYRRAIVPGVSSYAVYLWVLALAASLYAVRMESRVLLKLVVLGAVSGGALYVCVAVLAELGILGRRQRATT